MFYFVFILIFIKKSIYDGLSVYMADNFLVDHPLADVVVAEVKSLRGEERLVRPCLNTTDSRDTNVQSRLALSPV